MDGEALAQIRDDALWILLIIVGGLLVLRFARAPIRRVLQRVFERQVQPGSNERLSAADVQKRVDTVETLATSTIRFVVLFLVVVLVLVVLNLGRVSFDDDADKVSTRDLIHLMAGLGLERPREEAIDDGR